MCLAFLLYYIIGYYCIISDHSDTCYLISVFAALALASILWWLSGILKNVHSYFTTVWPIASRIDTVLPYTLLSDSGSCFWKGGPGCLPSARVVWACSEYLMDGIVYFPCLSRVCLVQHPILTVLTTCQTSLPISIPSQITVDCRSVKLVKAISYCQKLLSCYMYISHVIDHS